MSGEHPAPWRWEGDALYDNAAEALIWTEVDYSGGPPHAEVHVASARVAALTEAAPDLEAALRDMLGDTENSNAVTRRARALLAQIEERSRG